MADEVTCGQSADYGNILVSFIGNIRLVTKQIRDGETERESVDDFNLKNFWNKMEKVFKSISHEATKLSMAFSSPPCPDSKTCQSLISSVEKVTLALVSVFYTLPKSQGICLRKTTTSAILNILNDMLTLAETIKTYGSGSQEQLQSTGVVWQDADLFPKLPRDNKDAVLREMQKSSDLVRDALQEMQEAVESEHPGDDMAEALGLETEDPSNEEMWTEEDKTLLGPCLGLIKTSRSLIKKSKEAVISRGRCNSETFIAELDDLADYVERMSPAVDEFASGLYPPMKYDTVQENAKSLYTLHGTILHFLRKTHICCEEDQNWVEFILKANQHNWDNIKQHTDKIS